MIDASKVKVGDKLLMEVEVTYREGEIVKVKGDGRGNRRRPRRSDPDGE